MSDFEILRRSMGGSSSGGFDVTQTVPQIGMSGPDDVVTHVEDPKDGETVLVRYTPGGGITMYKVENAPRFTRIEGR